MMKMYFRKPIFSMLAISLFALPNLAFAEMFAPEALRESVAAVLCSDRILIRGQSVNDRDYYTKEAENVRGSFYPGMRRQFYLDGIYDVFDFAWVTDGNIYSLISQRHNRVINQKTPQHAESECAAVAHPDIVYFRKGKNEKSRKANSKTTQSVRQKSNFHNMTRHFRCVLSTADCETLTKKYGGNMNADGDGIFDDKWETGRLLPDINAYIGSGQETYKEKEYQYLEYSTAPNAAVAWTKRLYFLDGKLVKLVARRNDATLSFADMMRPLNFRTSVSVSGFYVCDIDEFTNDVSDESLDPFKESPRRKLGFAQ